VDEFYAAPMLQLEGWRTPQPLHEMLLENRWDNSATP
jgi:5,6-dimethylbenzimidazole synthase